MNHQSRKRHEKNLRRRRKVAEKQKSAQTRVKAMQAEREYRAAYPEFTCKRDDHTPEEFITLVRAAIAKINFEDRALFTSEEASFYLEVKENGAKAAHEKFRHAQTTGLGSGHSDAETWPKKLGQVVFSEIPRDDLERFLPYHDFFIHPYRNQILVRLRSLIQVDAPDGPFYHSPRMPTVTIRGEKKVICFRWHAIERICERLVPGGWQSYNGMGEVFGYLYQCQEFDVVPLHPNQIGFTFYDDCAKGYWSRKIAEEVLGSQYLPDSDYSYRVGYCPAKLHGDFIFGWTLLCPGYGNTPEFGRILSSSLPQQERSRLINEVKGLDIHRFVKTGDFAILKWFHEHGVPQVIGRETRYHAL